jgi:hypothetical protein
MFTSSTHRRAVVATVAVANAKAREACIATAEATTQQAVETARAAVIAVEAAAAALREKDVDDRDGARPRDPHRHRNVSPSAV